MSLNKGMGTVPDVITVFYYVLEKYVVCATTFVTCHKSDFSVVIFASARLCVTGK